MRGRTQFSIERQARRETWTALKAEIEEAAQGALDTADHLMAILDRLEPRLDDEPGADDEPNLGAPEGHESRVVRLRGTNCDLELDQKPEIRP